ncbi:M61 family metallopeptidase [Psychroflexus lacisalsi]|uniref:Peptidase M61 n=1 Tax=Psychroflexus lacisalsi TaxID=503928 RepID=A0ABP3VDX3_9FLAO|nr:peptidase M61 [Psychroflexus lacisalsi]MBZ9619316.1 peptidase M61 [Psychroflexus lacisalsi]
MKKIILALAVVLSVVSCKTVTQPENDLIVVDVFLHNVENDKVKVTVNPGRISSDSLKFYLPKTVPGTYAINDYGQFSQDLVALDYDGEAMETTRNDDDTWVISNSSNFDKLTYYVNDTYDIEGEGGVFSPAGTNFEAGDNFMLNLHAMVGYFENAKETPYKINIHRPSNLTASASLPVINRTEQEDYVIDEFSTERYFGVIDHPILYSKPDTTSFDIEGMKVLLSIHSPNGVHSTEDLKPALEKMVQAQKSFLGEIDNTNVYAILLYLSDMENPDARGFGALEHHTSTSVVLPETMTLQELEESMTDVVSHEFFHIITPLNIHSKEVHYFDYNDPEMSQHLWMYEGVTEYFANLFQIDQGLISEEDFYQRMNEKIETSMAFDDTMSFTVMSENILEEDYKDSYYNVYQKGALIGMALDIRLRELSGGEMGILDLMKQLISKYGKDTPFEDDVLISEIVDMTYPEIQSFFDKHVSGNTPIPYDEYFAKVGVEKTESLSKTGYFLNGRTPFIDANQDEGTVFFRESYPMNSFFKDLGVEGGDVIKSINGTEYTLENIRPLIMTSMGWQEGEDFKIVIVRNGEEMTFEGKTSQPYIEKTSLQSMEVDAKDPKFKLRQAWLKG